MLVLPCGWWDTVKLEASEMHRTVNISHEQTETDLYTLSVFSASTSQVRKINRQNAIFFFLFWICGRSVKLSLEPVETCNVSNRTKYNTSSGLQSPSIVTIVSEELAATIFRAVYQQYIKGKAIPLQAWTGPEGSRRFRLPDFKTIATLKVVRLSALRTGHLYTPGNIPGTHFCQRPSRPQGHSAVRRIMLMKNSSDTIGNRTRDLPTSSAVPQPTALRRAL